MNITLYFVIFNILIITKTLGHEKTTWIGFFDVIIG